MDTKKIFEIRKDNKSIARDRSKNAYLEIIKYATNILNKFVILMKIMSSKEPVRNLKSNLPLSMLAKIQIDAYTIQIAKIFL